MRLPRMTTRRWMITVGVVGVMLGTWLGMCRRREQFERMAHIYDSPPAPIFMNAPSGDELARADRLVIWRIEMAEKYRQAARRPWLPVSPDPPPPQ